MRILLVVVAILVAVEARAHQNWDNPFNNPGFGNGRGNNPGFGNGRGNNPGFGNGRGHNHDHVPFWALPLQQNNHPQNIAFGPDVEWVCQNPKTKDVMIIAADNAPRNPNPYPGRGPWQNFPPGHQRHEQEGSPWTRPIIIIQQGANDNDGGNQTPSPETHNNDNQPQTTPRYHGGEGQIDIRLGTQSS